MYTAYKILLVLSIALSITSCGGGGGGSDPAPAPAPAPPPPPPEEFTISGSVTGLENQTVSLDLNTGVDTLVISNNGDFRFGETITENSSYTVSVSQQPEFQTCSIANNSGTASGNVDDIEVTCAGYGVGGEIIGVSQGEFVELALNGVSETFSNSGSFQFGSTLLFNVPYEVTVVTPTSTEVCQVENGNGAYAGNTISNILVTCGNLVPKLNQVADFNQETVTQSTNPFAMTPFKDGFLFTADTPTQGSEPWFSNRTAQGTFLLADLNPGLGDSSPGQYFDLGNGTALFAATSKEAGRELWITDGTPNGTRQIADINPGTEDSNPSGFVQSDQFVFFTAETPDEGRELWRYNLAGQTTSLVMDTRIGIASGITLNGGRATGVLFDNRLFFVAEDRLQNPEIWASDGTASGTSPLTSFVQSIPPDSLTVFQNELYFFAESTSLYALSASGTLRFIVDPDPTRSRFSALDLTVVDSTLYFGSSLPGTDRAYWVSDGTTSGTTPVVVSTGFAIPIDFISIAGELHFRAGEELWRTDGTTAGSVAVTDQLRNPYISFSSGLILGRETPNEGAELWFYDGISTTLLEDIAVGTASGALNFHGGAVVGSEFYFPGAEAQSGSEIWVTRGTPQSTQLAVNATSDDATALGLNDLIGISGNELLIQAKSGNEWGLYRFNTSNDEFTPSEPQFSFNNIATINAPKTINETVYFGLNEGPGARGLFTFRQGNLAPQLVSNAPVPTTLLGQLGNRYAYAGQDASFFNIITLSDGTDSGTTEVPNAIDVFDFSEFPNQVGNAVMRASPRSGAGPNGELWRTDGTAAGTALLADLSGSTSSQPTNFMPLNDVTLFAAQTPFNGNELFSTNGTTAGSGLLLDLAPGPDSSLPRDGNTFGDLLYFTAGFGVNFKHWVSDGTSAGTQLAYPTIPTLKPTDESPKTLLNSMYFAATDDVGVQLWLLSQPGGVPVKLADISPGDPISEIEDFWSLGPFVFFRVFDSDQNAWVLWYTDGTPLGTQPLRNDVFISNWTHARLRSTDKTYLIADDRKTGNELWEVTLEIEP